jgi:ParB-like chromosome segregation protein Spo0J
MKTTQVPVSELTKKLDPENARKHSDRNVRAIAHSLQQFGQQKPIVLSPDGVVIAGNGTVLAAEKLGLKRLAAVVSELDAEKLRQFAIADNRTAELAEWDYEVLAGALKQMQDEGADLQAHGWAEHELDVLLGAVWSPPAAEPGALDTMGTTPGSNVVTIVLQDEQLEILVAATDAVAGDFEEPPTETQVVVACLKRAVSPA